MGFFSAIASAVNVFSRATKNVAVQAASVPPFAKQEPRFTHNETERGIETRDAYTGLYEFEPKPQLPRTDSFYKSADGVWGNLAKQTAEYVRRVSGALGLLALTTEHDYATEVNFPSGTDQLAGEANTLLTIIDEAPKALLKKVDHEGRRFVDRIGKDLPTPAFKEQVSFVALLDRGQEEGVVRKPRQPSSWAEGVVESRLQLTQAVRAA